MSSQKPHSMNYYLLGHFFTSLPDEIRSLAVCIKDFDLEHALVCYILGKTLIENDRWNNGI